MSDDSPTEVKASPPASEEAGRAPAEAQGKPRPTGRFKRTLKAIGDWAANSELVEEVFGWVFGWVLIGVGAAVGVGALLLFSRLFPDVGNSVGNWIVDKDPDPLSGFVLTAVVLLTPVVVIATFLVRALRWLAGKISARRADRQGDMRRGCRADHRAGGWVVFAVLLGAVVFAVLLGAALFLLRRRGDR